SGGCTHRGAANAGAPSVGTNNRLPGREQRLRDCEDLVVLEEGGPQRESVLREIAEPLQAGALLRLLNFGKFCLRLALRGCFATRLLGPKSEKLLPMLRGQIEFKLVELFLRYELLLAHFPQQRHPLFETLDRKLLFGRDILPNALQRLFQRFPVLLRRLFLLPASNAKDVFESRPPVSGSLFEVLLELLHLLACVFEELV